MEGIISVVCPRQHLQPLDAIIRFVRLQGFYVEIIDARPYSDDYLFVIRVERIGSPVFKSSLLRKSL